MSAGRLLLSDYAFISDPVIVFPSMERRSSAHLSKINGLGSEGGQNYAEFLPDYTEYIGVNF